MSHFQVLFPFNSTMCGFIYFVILCIHSAIERNDLRNDINYCSTIDLLPVKYLGLYGKR